LTCINIIPLKGIKNSAINQKCPFHFAVMGIFFIITELTLAIMNEEIDQNPLLIEEFNLNTTIELTELYKKYFTPIDINYIPTTENPDLLDKIKTQHEQFRKVNETFNMVFQEAGENLRVYHEDSQIYQLIARLLFKKEYNVLSEDELSGVTQFFNQIIDLIILYKVDYWYKMYSSYQEHISKEGFNEDIEEIHLLKQLIDKWENIQDVELYLRKKDSYGSVIVSETQNIRDEELRKILEPYIKSKYYNFIQEYSLTKYISDEQFKELALYKSDIKKKKTLTWFVSEAIIILYIKENITPSFTFSYFEKLYNLLNDNTHFDTKLTPLYEFLKTLVPPLNRFIEDHAINNYKKKDKHMLIFSLLRSFEFVPDKSGLELNGGDIDKKEDFIKQLLR